MVKAQYQRPEGRGFDSRYFHRKFLLIQSFRPHYGTAVESASNENENLQYLWGIEARGA